MKYKIVQVCQIVITEPLRAVISYWHVFPSRKRKYYIIDDLHKPHISYYPVQHPGEDFLIHGRIKMMDIAFQTIMIFPSILSAFLTCSVRTFALNARIAVLNELLSEYRSQNIHHCVLDYSVRSIWQLVDHPLLRLIYLHGLIGGCVKSTAHHQLPNLPEIIFSILVELRPAITPI